MAIHPPVPSRHIGTVDSILARRALAILVAAHGLAHLAGTGDAFSRAADGRSAHYLAGDWTVSDPTTFRALGVLWAAMAAAFLATAACIWAGRSLWPRLLWWVSLASLLLVLVALWASVVGVFVDVALLAIAWHAGAFSHDGEQA
jgi:hypothetical protein